MADLIAEIGEEILRRVSEQVKDIQSPETRETAQTLFSNLSGLGLAAPQVRKSLRMFVQCSRPTPAYPDAPQMAPTLVINPEILKRSDELDKGWEGCMSIPGIRGLVPRSCKTLVRFMSSEGNMQTLELSGLPARIFQHEYDHLEGIFYLDRLESTQDIISENVYQRMVAKNDV
jgi:peptide deformylase